MTLGDRIVIMKDGVIQQIGTPQTVYDNPVNLFVAGFIGVPQMNFYDGTLIKKADGSYAVQVEDAVIDLSAEKCAHLKDRNVEGQEVTIGVRPEHITLTKTADAGSEGKQLHNRFADRVYIPGIDGACV